MPLHWINLHSVYINAITPFNPLHRWPWPLHPFRCCDHPSLPTRTLEACSASICAILRQTQSRSPTLHPAVVLHSLAWLQHPPQECSLPHVHRLQSQAYQLVAASIYHPPGHFATAFHLIFEALSALLPLPCPPPNRRHRCHYHYH